MSNNDKRRHKQAVTRLRATPYRADDEKVKTTRKWQRRRLTSRDIHATSLSQIQETQQKRQARQPSKHETEKHKKRQT